MAKLNGFTNEVRRLPRDRNPPYRADQLDTDLLRVLAASEIPLSAYEIATRLRESVRHVMAVSIYRSLHRLCAEQRVERVEMVSGFRIKDAPASVLAICAQCGRTVSVTVASEHAAIERAIAAIGFVVGKVALEASGICSKCRK
ncbi:hypothetical protein EWE75_21690 [Sphingomonas populi]|uniref:Uncharacterized protein n=1 Tax=Sphingomonas populi TaxID=2484750 RepID=A0A4Q6XUZ1_9SPHN|nr:transcriptional repressor [Sphingomonas populi]RZF60689.1 hypothetical protein EWE75_21690 [Sphingomonas populi]